MTSASRAVQGRICVSAFHCRAASWLDAARGGLRHPDVEDVYYQSPRGLDRALFLKLAACEWIAERRNLLLTGASGLGKSWLSCALGHRACRENSIL
jgi:DNA replication protein DnaC